MTVKYTKWPQNISNGHKIYQMAKIYLSNGQNISNGRNRDQMALKYRYQPLPLQDPPKFTQMRILGAIWQPWVRAQISSFRGGERGGSDTGGS
jgi:hypothetical protein